MLRVIGGGKQDWATPSWLFDALDRVFSFQLDAAADKRNAKCLKFYTRITNGLKQPWFSTTFCNPPWSNPAPWCAKAHQEAEKNISSVLLLPLLGMTASWYRTYGRYAHTTILSPRIAFDGPKRSPNGGAIVMCFGFPYSNGSLSFLDVTLIREIRQRRKSA